MAAPFFSRLFSTLILWAVIGGVIWSGSEWMFALLVAMFGLATSWEYSLLVRASVNDGAQFGLIMLLSVGYWVAMVYHAIALRSEPPLWIDIAFLMLALQAAFIIALRRPLAGRETLLQVFATVFGVVFAIIPFGFVIRLMFFGSQGSGATGLFLMLFVIMLTKFSDTGAYLVGSMIGRHKMIPHISPAKSWEGLGGAFLGAAIGTLIMLKFFGPSLSPLTSTSVWVLMPILVLSGVAGDLAESVLKRCTAVKDSGHSLPGIGGILDLTDSLLFTAPLAYFWVKMLS
jgi:phosphatidate cytidylyltransferase